MPPTRSPSTPKVVGRWPQSWGSRARRLLCRLHRPTPATPSTAGLALGVAVRAHLALHLERHDHPLRPVDGHPSTRSPGGGGRGPGPLQLRGRQRGSRGHGTRGHDHHFAGGTHLRRPHLRRLVCRTPSGGAALTSPYTLSASTTLYARWSADTPPPPPPVTSSSTVSHGYWLDGSDGGIFGFGAAQFYGSTGSLTLQRPVVGIVPTKDHGGYWLDASDGGVFSFGDTQFYGSIPGLGLHPAGSAPAEQPRSTDRRHGPLHRRQRVLHGGL